MPCKHEKFKKVHTHGNSSKPSYWICSKCKKVLNMDEKKKLKWKPTKKKKYVR